MSVVVDNQRGRRYPQKNFSPEKKSVNLNIEKISTKLRGEIATEHDETPPNNA